MAKGRVLAPDGRQHQHSWRLLAPKLKITNKVPEQRVDNEDVIRDILKYAKSFDQKNGMLHAYNSGDTSASANGDVIGDRKE